VLVQYNAEITGPLAHVLERTAAIAQ
jgi:hypothetical protein